MVPLEIRELEVDELERVYEVDRSESVDRMYRQSEGELEAYDDNLAMASEPEFWGSHIEPWRNEMEAGAVAYGAFDGDRLAGFAIVKLDFAPGVAEMIALYVSAEYRLSGVAKSLFVEAQQAAKRFGAKHLYVATPPTGSAVGFYLSQGFTALASPHPATPPLEEGRIPMMKELHSERRPAR